MKQTIISVLLAFVLITTSLAFVSFLMIETNDLSYGGQLFMTRHSDGACVLADLDGNIFFERQISTNSDLRCYDFKRLYNGDWIYFNQAAKRWEQYAPFSDTIKATYTISGSQTDLHDIIVTDDYVWLMGRQLYTAISGTLTLNIRASTIQKRDHAGNILFDWNSKDHVGLDEATIDLFAFTNPSFPHSNSFFEDNDGNLIVSFRNASSVMKICVTWDGCQAGEVIWRVGGTKSDFDIIDDRGISSQHSAIMADRCHGGINRCLLLFDNGNDFDPPYSRAVEYVLNVNLGLVTKTWEYTADGQYLALATGNVNRLPNGDTVIGWGRAHFEDPDAPAVTVVDWGGNVKYEANFVTEGETSYRAHLYPIWRRVYLPVVAR